jgi:hypothetical protein
MRNRPLASEVLRKEIIKLAVFWVVASCSLVEVYRRFRGAFCLHYEGNEAASTSEKSVNFYETMIRCNSEDSHFKSLTSIKLMVDQSNLKKKRVFSLQIPTQKHASLDAATVVTMSPVSICKTLEGHCRLRGRAGGLLAEESTGKKVSRDRRRWHCGIVTCCFVRGHDRPEQALGDPILLCLPPEKSDINCDITSRATLAVPGVTTGSR